MADLELVGDLNQQYLQLDAKIANCKLVQASGAEGTSASPCHCCFRVRDESFSFLVSACVCVCVCVALAS